MSSISPREFKASGTGSGCLDKLRRQLRELPPGPIDPDTASELEDLLAQAWDELEGSDAGGMTPGKIRGRVEEPAWKPPVLSFVIERHGRTAMGSTRADLQLWLVDVEAGTARYAHAGYRQVLDRDRPVRVRPIVEEVVRAILAGQDHPAVRKLKGGRVEIMPGQIRQLSGWYRATEQGRRRRFAKELERQLAEAGWCRVGPHNRHIYQPCTGPTGKAEASEAG
jgi:hypothetical protein